MNKGKMLQSNSESKKDNQIQRNILSGQLLEEEITSAKREHRDERTKMN